MFQSKFVIYNTKMGYLWLERGRGHHVIGLGPQNLTKKLKLAHRVKLFSQQRLHKKHSRVENNALVEKDGASQLSSQTIPN